MFGKKNLSQDGSQGQAIILDARPGNILNRHGERNWHLRVRLHFGDGQTTEADCEVYDLAIATVGPASGIEPYPLAVGGMIPVRYDQKDGSHVVIDRQKMIEDTKGAYEASRQSQIARAEHALAPNTQSAAEGDETDELYVIDAMTAAETRGDTAEVQRLTRVLGGLIGGSEAT